MNNTKRLKKLHLYCNGDKEVSLKSLQMWERTVSVPFKILKVKEDYLLLG